MRQRRDAAAKLLYGVVYETLTPRRAINQWPVVLPGEAEDRSLSIAYQALWHFESGEERRATEPLYSDLQLELLTVMAEHLEHNRDFPSVLQVYYQNQTIPAKFYLPQNTVLGPFAQVISFIERLWEGIKMAIKYPNGRHIT